MRKIHFVKHQKGRGFFFVKGVNKVYNYLVKLPLFFVGGGGNFQAKFEHCLQFIEFGSKMINNGGKIQCPYCGFPDGDLGFEFCLDVSSWSLLLFRDK